MTSRFSCGRISFGENILVIGVEMKCLWRTKPPISNWFHLYHKVIPILEIPFTKINNTDKQFYSCIYQVLVVPSMPHYLITVTLQLTEVQDFRKCLCRYGRRLQAQRVPELILTLKDQNLLRHHLSWLWIWLHSKMLVRTSIHQIIGCQQGFEN